MAAKGNKRNRRQGADSPAERGVELGALANLRGGRQKVLIVDGHSIIFAWPELRAMHTARSQQRATAREMLLRKLVNYQDLRQVKVVVVFDGQGEKATEDAVASAGIGVQVFYAARGQTADTVVERLVAAYAEQYDITVATCDSMERQTVISLGGSTIDALRLQVLLEEVEDDLERQLREFRKRK